MKYLYSFFVFLLSAYIMILMFLPREKLWYFAEDYLQKYNIVIADEKLSSTPPLLEINDGLVLYSGMEVLKFETGSILPAFFYNVINIYNVKIGKDFQQFKELYFEKLSADYSVGQYQKVFIFGKGSFGELRGRVNIFDRTIDLLLIPEESFKKSSLINMFKKHENGGYIYNGKF